MPGFILCRESVMKITKLFSTVALSISLAMPLTAAGVITPATMALLTQPAEAQNLKKGFKNFSRKLKKGIRKTRKKVSRTIKKGGNKKVLQLVGAGLAVYGISKGSRGAAILGVTLAAAPRIFTKDIAKSYGRELNWSGCTRCNKKRIVSSPGRKISKKQRSEFSKRVKDDVKDIQSALKTLGLYSLKVDGDYGRGSRKAVRAFQKSINVAETGYLNAEQRYLLFKKADEKGYTRVASLNNFGESKPVEAVATNTQANEITQKPQKVHTGPVIAQFRLASSQFNKFTEDFLKTGSQAIVTDAEMLPDGTIKLELFDQYTNKKNTIVGSLTNIEVAAHDLSESWIQFSYKESHSAKPTILNTRDDFSSVELATSWKNKADQHLDILAKLVGVEQNAPKTLIASNAQGRVVISEEVSPTKTETSTPKVEAANTEESVVESGRVVIAEAKEESTRLAINDQPKEVEAEPIQKTELSEDAPLAVIEEAPDSVQSEVAVSTTGQEEAPQEVAEIVNASLDPLASFNNSAIEESCRQDLYVSFSFPNGENPINHFNITPPDGTIMMDNGDTTAYFTGSCVQGNYDFSYVHIKEAQKQKDWKHFKREGTFQIASNNEQCAIDLNTPDGSASIQCY